MGVLNKNAISGVFSKRRRAPYRSGRGGDWLKIKCVQSDGFMIVGYEKSGSAFGKIGSLLLAARKAGELVYVGSVGTGFNERSEAQLREAMDKINAPAAKYSGRRKMSSGSSRRRWPRLKYRAWAHDGKARHASYKGLREVQNNAAAHEID
ncbi:ATP-dependent carboligase [Rhizobium leguminosarum]|uniref:ATP dependent DNA ligase n=1 Tax=Rhizobium TaxID=379 RepID=UPI00140FC246|nr:ATP-dependent carboligase [Rhizobium leguminosarum]QIO64917.1 ATP-dependent carboligase [Rhizobium leguminosarum bv. trifolii]